MIPAKNRSPALLLGAVTLIALSISARGAEVQTRNREVIVLVRHGEKPPQGLGQLTCRGLNRALLLPGFFAEHFAKPDYIFAPDPSVKATEIHGDGRRYDYVRPLETIAPTAIRLGMPIDTQLPYNDPGRLADVLLDAPYRSATVFVAWEHQNLVDFAAIVLRRMGSSAEVPPWDNSDYDRVFVLTIDWSKPAAELAVRSEGLKEISDQCPNAHP